MPGVWRILVDGPTDGAANMGIDAALLESRIAGGPPTLRIYRWDRPTVSLGRFQSVEDLDSGACSAAGVSIVRRPTGGRGVLHHIEVTYSVVAAEADGVPRGTAESYRHLCAGLAEAYRLLGVDAELTSRDRGPRSGACYLHATRADLSLGGLKLSGSAQVWRDRAVLQHGSVVLSRDLAVEAAVFGLDADATALLGRTATALDEVLPASPPVDAVIDALTCGFATVMGVSLQPGELSSAELDAAARLAGRARVEDVDAG